MTNSKILLIVVVILVVVAVGLFFLLGNKAGQKETGTGQQTPLETGQATSSSSSAEQAVPADTTIVDCSEATNPSCFLDRMTECLPVTAKMTGSDGETAIEITILGIENDKCHFQRKLNGVLNLDCYFPKGTLNWDTIDQTFGNDKGLQKVVDDACKPAGW